MTHRIAIVQGDGIGPEISEATKSVLLATGVSIEWVEAPLGLEAMSRYGEPFPDSSLDRIREVGCAIKGPLVAEKQSGGIVFSGKNGERRYPSINNALRQVLGTYANLRPARGWKGISGNYADLDIVIVRETTEDIYAGIERQVDASITEATKRITKGASQRIARFAFDYARAHNRRQVTIAHKANVLHLTDGLFLKTVREVSRDYPEIECNDCMIDAMCYRLVTSPDDFDLLVLPSQYGDIVSDLAAGLIGSLGLAPGANIGEEVAYFEAAHGAAPDIAGQGIANPISLILSSALMLDYLKEAEAAQQIRHGVSAVLEEGRCLTPDLGGSHSTQELGQAICEAIGSESYSFPQT